MIGKARVLVMSVFAALMIGIAPAPAQILVQGSVRGTVTDQQGAALPGAVYAMIVGAGFGEETVFRGWMFERFGKLFGRGAWASVLVVMLTSLWFGLDHYSMQGLAGAEQALIVGLVFGTIMTKTRNIWILMVAHAAFDLHERDHQHGG